MDQESLHILLVQDDSSSGPVLVDGLLDDVLERTYRVSHANHVEQAMEALADSLVDCILLDFHLPARLNLESLSKLQGSVPDIPIVVITRADDHDQGVEAVQRGAQDFLIKGRISQDVIVTSVEFAIERNRIREQLRQGSLTDTLTGLKNRGAFDSLAEHTFQFAIRRRQRLVLLFMDLDSLKSINDSLGHREGDAALIDVAGLLKESFRGSDLVGRVGGDEFCVLLIGASDREAQTSVERLQDAIDGHNRTADRPYELSLSIGMAVFSPDAPCSVSDLMNEADVAMYEAKRGTVIRLSVDAHREMSQSGCPTSLTL